MADALGAKSQTAAPACGGSTVDCTRTPQDCDVAARGAPETSGPFARAFLDELEMHGISTSSYNLSDWEKNAHQGVFIEGGTIGPVP